MFSKFLTKIRAVSPRTNDWAGRLGPVATFSAENALPNSGSTILRRFAKSPKDCDFYAEVALYDQGPIECPPETVMFLPVLQCGAMLAGGEEDAHGAAKVEPPPSRDEWYLGVTEATTDLLEKGYIPVNVGGDGSATLPMIESYKRIHNTDEVVLLHFSAYPRISAPLDPIHVLLEKNLLKGVVSIGNRCVSAADRKIRKQHKLFYMDMHAIYAKGLFCIRDVRNDYPVFISIDASVLDPAFAPGVADPVPGGLSTRDLLHIMGGIRGPRVAGIDIHGYDPELDVYRKDGTGLTELALAKVLKEAILKAYCISTVTAEEGMARVEMMQRQGTLADNPYPDH